MPIKVDIFTIVILLGIAQGLFLAYYFGFRKVRSGQNSEFWLVLLLLAFSINLFEILMCQSNLAFQHLWVVDLAEPALLTLGPLYYLYISNKIQKLDLKPALLHLLPALIYGFYLTLIFYSRPDNIKLNAYTLAYHPEFKRIPQPDAFPGWVYLWRRNINLFIALQAAAYLFFTFRLIDAQLKKAGQAWWQVEPQNLRWLRNNFLVLLGLLLAFVLVKICFFRDVADYLLASFVSIYIYGISIQLLHYSHLFNGIFNTKKTPSTFPQEILERINSKFADLQLVEKPFLNPAYSLPQFSKELGLSTNQASQYLNEYIGKSFFEFLADRRIHEAKILLIQQPDLKIEDLAFQVGYYSKSSFNTAFKKITGQTPSEYRKNPARSN